MLKEKVEKTIQKYSLIPPNSKILVALSGGPDSVSLLHVLLDLKEKLHIEIAAAHLNHMLRGKESERDENFVRKLCESWNVPVYIERKDVKEISKGKNIEAIARNVRYKFLEETLKKIGADLIATGHTASDLLETVILNLVKGTGIKGLRGFLPKRGKIIRPLFEATREEIEKYVSENNLPFVIDSSNLKTDFERNLVRLKVVPILKSINPKVENAVLRNAEILRDVEEFLFKEVKNFLSLYLKEERFSVPLEVFKNLPKILQEEIIREAFKKISGKTLSYTKVISALELLSKDGYKELFPSLDIVIFKDQLSFCIEKRKKEDKEFFFRFFDFPKTIETPFGVLEFKIWDGKEEGVIIPYKKAKEEGITVRTRQPGDRLRFKNFTKPLKKFFIEKKVPAKLRSLIPIALLEEEIIWIPNNFKAYVNFNPTEKCIVARTRDWNLKF